MKIELLKSNIISGKIKGAIAEVSDKLATSLIRRGCAKLHIEPKKEAPKPKKKQIKTYETKVIKPKKTKKDAE